MNIDDESKGYAFFKSCGQSESAVSEAFALGFVSALADCATQYKTIKEAFLDYFDEVSAQAYVELLKDFRLNQADWVRWPNLAIE